ncbi:MAG: VCBS repeat-containing protein [Halobacteriales archaeon]|nr:VCBS repeat-containing protein [Halobacteriales archaeon]
MSHLRTIPIACAGLMLLASLAPSALAATTLVRTIDTASAQPDTAFLAFDADPPKVFDFNADGKQEIIDQNDQRGVYVFDSSTGALLAQLKTWYPAGWGARPINGVEAAIIVRNGSSHLIVANSAAVITDFVFDAAASTATNFTFHEAWHRWLNDCYSYPGMDSKPVLADLLRNGQMEILGQTEETGVYALKPDGTLLWKQCIGGGNGEPGVGDLDADGWLDVVWCSDGGTCTASKGTTGATRWAAWIAGRFNLSSGSMPVGPALAQLDGQAGDDVVIGARDSHDGTNFSNDHAVLAAINSWGGVMWGFRDPGGNPLTYTHPIVVDTDGDGQKEIYWGDWNTIGHKPPWEESKSWTRTGPAHYYRIDLAGNMVWKQTLDTYWSNKDIIVGDVDGDGAQEVVANGPGPGGDGMWYLSSATGAKETFVGTSPWKVQRGAILADLWGSGTGQLVVPVSAACCGVHGGAISIFDTHVPFHALAPHLPYPDFQGSTTPPPPPPPPPNGTGGTFNAAFRLGNVNNWWVETYITSATPIAAVYASVDGGAWIGLAHQSYGSWAKSFHVATGASVVFRALSPAGASADSPPFRWLDGSAPPPPPPPPNGTFSATFKLGNINNWWVEAYVTANAPVSAVSAQVDGGSWTALAHQSWGAWAKSFHVATGASVVFRATDASGRTASSAAFPWMTGGSTTSTGTSSGNETSSPPPPEPTNGTSSDPGSTPPPPPPPPPDGGGSGGTPKPVWSVSSSSGFASTFTIASGASACNVAVKVTSSHAIAYVYVAVDARAYGAMTLGNGVWSRSVCVPAGGQVHFLAKDGGGAASTTAKVDWPKS